MEPRLSPKRTTAMTLFEVGVCIAVVMVLAILLVPRLVAPRRSSKINCVNQLKQIGLAYRIWEGDNGDIYPMGVSVTNGGSMELVATGNVVQTFLAMSNELSTPMILFCPMDSTRVRARDFSGMANSNVSFFVSLDTTNSDNPQMILSGDCDFEIGGAPVKSGLQTFGTNLPVAWSAARHGHAGNLGFADGSVQQTTSARLQFFLEQTGLATNRFALP